MEPLTLFQSSKFGQAGERQGRNRRALVCGVAQGVSVRSVQRPHGCHLLYSGAATVYHVVHHQEDCSSVELQFSYFNRSSF